MPRDGSAAGAVRCTPAPLPCRVQHLQTTGLHLAVGLPLSSLRCRGLYFQRPPCWLSPRCALQLQELDSIVNHMHTREDLFRRAIK